MARKRTAEVAKTTIRKVLAQFLADQQVRLGPKTFANYRSVVELLQHSIDGYAYSRLAGPEKKLFDQLYEAKGDAHREFCDVFGPERILPNVHEFLSYFMVRKVCAGRELLRASGTVTKKLAAWLAEKGYVEAEAAADAAQLGGEAAHDLPKADELGFLLHDFAEDQQRDDVVDEVEDHFGITRAERGRIWLRGMLDGRELGPIPVPEEIRDRCQVGWTISGVVGRQGKSWLLVEVWNVYPR